MSRKMIYAPIAVFAYNRKDKLEYCIEALAQNEEASETEVFVFADGSKGKQDYDKVAQVRDYLKRYAENSVFKHFTVIASEKNQGLANSIIRGVTQIVKEYDRVIVVEDDIIAAPDFLSYMNGALEYYKDLKQYGSISAYTESLKGLDGYKKDVYATRKGECWGWGTWRDRWECVDWEVKGFEEFLKNKKTQRQFDKLQAGISDMLKDQMEGKLDSWAVRWCFHLFRNGLLTVYPKYSRVKNIGFDGSGTHCTGAEAEVGSIENKNQKCVFETVGINEALEKENADITRRSIFQRGLDHLVKKLKGKK